MNKFILNYGLDSLLIVLAMLPTFVLGFIVYKKDVVEKEPIKLLLKLFIFGVLSAGVALFIELTEQDMFPGVLSNNVISIIIRSFLIVALSEELVKWVFNYFISWKDKEFNYAYDAIVYSVFISLGFATIENLITILTQGGGFVLAIQRGLITVPAHAFFGVISGYYLGKAKRYNNRNWKKRKKYNLILSLLAPVLVHGLFDALLFLSDKITMTFSIILIVYLYISSIYKIIKVSKETRPIIKG